MDKPEWIFWPTQHIWNLLRKQIWSILTENQKKKKKNQTTVWGDHIRSLHCTLNRYHFDSQLSANKVSIRGVWNPSNRTGLSCLCPALWPRCSLWRLHHWIGCNSPPAKDAHPVSGSLPERQLLSLCARFVCTHICPCPVGQHTHSSAGVSIVCAQAQPSTLRCHNGSLKSVLLRVYTPRERAH